MATPEQIKRDCEIRDICLKCFRSYLKGAIYEKTLEEIKRFLDLYLGCLHQYQIDSEGVGRKIYGNKDKFYNQFIVRLYFPLQNICVCCSMDFARSHPVIKNHLDGPYKEVAASFIYYDPTLRIKCPGCQLVVLTVPPKSIILEDGKNLAQLLKGAY